MKKLDEVCLLSFPALIGLSYRIQNSFQSYKNPSFWRRNTVQLKLYNFHFYLSAINRLMALVLIERFEEGIKA